MFDMTTVFLFGALICVVSALMLYMSRHLHSASVSGVNAATAAECCLAVGMLLIALKGVLPAWASGPLAGSFGLLASALIYESTRRISGERSLVFRLRWLVPLVLAGQWLIELGLPGQRAQAVIVSLLQGGFVAACVPLLWRAATREQTLAVNWGITFSVLYTVAHTARAIMTGLFSSQGPIGLFQPDSVIAACAVLIAVAPMVYAIVIISLVNGRVSADYRRQAEVDVLTGLHTRRSFFNRGEAALQSPGPDQHTPVMVMLDLDKFKSINDLHGHAWGDRILSEFSRMVRACCPTNSLLGRFGGEEFCVMLFCPSAEQAAQVARDIVGSARAWRGQPGDGPGRFTVSAGMAVAPEDGQSLEALIASADRRLYMAKAGGRDQLVIKDTAGAGSVAPDWLDVVPV